MPRNPISAYSRMSSCDGGTPVRSVSGASGISRSRTYLRAAACRASCSSLSRKSTGAPVRMRSYHGVEQGHAMGLLTGIRVLDFGRYVAGPYFATLLGYLGAGVIRIERRGGGEDRFIAPITAQGEGAVLFQTACNKRSLTLDFRSEEHTSELQSRSDLVCRLLLEKKKKTYRETSALQGRQNRVHPRIYVHPDSLGHQPSCDDDRHVDHHRHGAANVVNPDRDVATP